jgi:SAM-dependent methyltransferase
MDAPILSRLTTLADPLRARILLLLDRQELSVSELCDVLRLPQSTVSRHLKTLAEDGWVVSRREGTSRLYAAAGESLDESARQLWAIVRHDVEITPAARQDQRRLAPVVEARRARSAAFFSSSAGRWDALRDELFGAGFHVRALLGLLDERWNVADLGCGTGRTAEVLAPFVRRVTAIDASEEMLVAARARLAPYLNVDVRHGTLETLPLQRGTVDAASMILVLHHVGDPGAVLSEAARILRPGGRLIVVDMLPHKHEEYRQQMGHVWLGFSEHQVTRYLTAAGFTSIRFTPLPLEATAAGPSLFAAVAAMPLEQTSRAAAIAGSTASLVSSNEGSPQAWRALHLAVRGEASLLTRREGET